MSLSKSLFLAYYFPPIAGSGVYRSAKFAKYLPQFGWQPYVISATEDIQLRQRDPTLLEDLPHKCRMRICGAMGCDVASSRMFVAGGR